MRELRERAGQIVRILCLILAGLVVYQLAGIVIRWNPFRGVTVPELPTLAAATNSVPPGGPPTNRVAATPANGTNTAPHSAPTNTPTLVQGKTTNSNAPATSAEKATNVIVHVEAGSTPTNLASSTITNPTARVIARLEAEHGITNSPTAMTSTNQGTNLLFSTTATDTNAAASKPKKPHGTGGPMPEMGAMNFNPFQPPAKPCPPLPPAVQSRISRITDSEILAPVMHPLPMALLGIAGDCAFLRSASGQTGLVKEGDSLDDIKLIRIGINRVLIELGGQKQELMIFSGYGGDSLLPKDSPNEHNP